MQVDVGPNFWLTQWNWQPSIIIGTILAIGLYLYAVGPLREKAFPAEEIKTSQVVMFLLGVNAIFLSLFSPLDKLGDTYLFSAHMVQHLALTLVGPPLMILGTPGWLIQPLLRNSLILRIARFLTHPIIAFLLFNIDFWLWHAPPLYIATLTHETLHIFEHMTFIVLGLIYWWPVFSPVKELPRLSIGGQILYLFLGGMPTVALGAGLTFMQPLYTPYIYAPRVWGMSPALDQQLGGLIMWIPGNIVAIIIASILFIRWMQAQDARQRAEEARIDAQANEVDLTDVEVVEHLS
ncbi:MAG TPA: cytochrome c oxidase assembly protein [Ktedonosporobacter sp.]|nr:cytochrome c oxidase assembly protein [Ktedonosporobacter sp.]